jgi:hypothetical protein
MVFEESRLLATPFTLFSQTLLQPLLAGKGVFTIHPKYKTYQMHIDHFIG